MRVIILLSPAKTLDFESSYPETPTRPRFAADASRLARAAAAIGPKDLGKLMHISDELADLNHQRFKRFGRSKAIERPAIRAFAGDVYRGFDADSADPDTIDYAQDHLRILSGLYGMLRPRDAIRPYRLEMGTRWSPGGGKLVDHWGDRVAKRLASDLRRDGSNLLINLASNEYFAVVKDQLPGRVRVITPDFRNRTAKGLQFQSFPAKVARGTMARWMCEERVEDPKALSQFDRGGWRFDAEASTPDRPMFVKG